MLAPTGEELFRNPIVLRAIEEAWRESLPSDSHRRHEEGGWIYAESTAGEIAVRRAASGNRNSVNLSRPEIVFGSMVIGTFHTHPNPSDEGWEPGPSARDLKFAFRNGIPCLIRSDMGISTTGPEIRRGGMTGEAGYPE